MSHADSLQVDTNLTYCPTTLAVSRPLTITNVSQHELAFKIKTNKKNLVSMNPCNGFIKPLISISIPVKIVQQVPESVSVKLEVDWCVVTPHMKQIKDIKMSTVTNQQIFKKVFPIVRKQQKAPNAENQSHLNEQKSISQPHVQAKKVEKVETKITPFEYEKKDIVEKQEQKKKQEQRKQTHHQKPDEITKQPTSQQEQNSDNAFEYRSANNMFTSMTSPTKSLQIVSEEDQDDHEKELQQIKSKQLQQLRAIDEIKSRIRKIKQQVKSTEIIDTKLLLLGLTSSFLVGSFLQYLIF